MEDRGTIKWRPRPPRVAVRKCLWWRPHSWCLDFSRASSMLVSRWDQVEYIDSLHTNMRGKLLAVFDLFISACWRVGIEIDLPVYIAWLLNNRRLYHYPYTSLCQDRLHVSLRNGGTYLSG